MRKIKIDKNERTQIKKRKLEELQLGKGLFLFKNRNSASLQLPKISNDGKKWVEPNETWEGDSFFLKMIPKEAILIKTIISPDDEEKEKKMSENKLILDQPDQITEEGKLEHIVSDDIQKINETQKPKAKSTKKKAKLITEDPVGDVTIIVD